MMTHVLDCLGALNQVQRLRTDKNKPLKLAPDSDLLSDEQQAVRIKVFISASTTMLSDLNGANSPPLGWSTRQLLHSFPDDSKLSDGRGWLPLHLAVALKTPNGTSVTAMDVKTIYGMDPLALRRCHLISTSYPSKFDEEDYPGGMSPAHMVVMEPATEPTNELLNFIAISDPQSLAMGFSCSLYNTEEYSFSSLHAACYFGSATVPLLQLLLQLDASMARRKSVAKGGYPLGLLFQGTRKELDDAILRCLLDADCSVEVVFDAVRQCLEFWHASTDVMLSTMSRLLKECPDCAKARDPATGKKLLHIAIESDFLEACRLEAVEVLLPFNTGALKVADNNGNLPAHAAACEGDGDVFALVFGAYPAAAATVNRNMETLLHCASRATDLIPTSTAELLCKRYPQMLTHRDSYGQTPLLKVLNDSLSCMDGRMPVLSIALCEAGGREGAAAAVGDPTEGMVDPTSGLLPLHYAVWTDGAEQLIDMLLRLYPEAVDICGGQDIIRCHGTPYEVSWVEYHRVLLRAAPHVDPAALRDLNWAERRMAMFLAFRAVSGRTAPHVLARLRFENKDLIKLVVSFL